MIDPEPTPEDLEELAKITAGHFLHLVEDQVTAQELRQAAFRAVQVVVSCLSRMGRDT